MLKQTWEKFTLTFKAPEHLQSFLDRQFGSSLLCISCQGGWNSITNSREIILSSTRMILESMQIWNMTHCRKLFKEALRPMTIKAQKNGCMQRTTQAVVLLNFWISWLKKYDKSSFYLFNQYFRDSAIDVHKWFAAKPLSKRTFASFFDEICTASGVQKKYTPHCLRATAITYLNDNGFEPGHIMFMSNHTNESSLHSYNRSMSSNQKKIPKQNKFEIGVRLSFSNSTCIEWKHCSVAYSCLS